jgi:hypothetical protein
LGDCRFRGTGALVATRWSRQGVSTKGFDPTIAGKDGAANQFGDLRDYGVSELPVSVNPSGNPMTCSAVSGTGYRWPSTRLHQSCQLFRSGFFTPSLGDCLPPLKAVALGVGHNPDSIPKLSGTNVGSGYAMPFRIIPERGQVSENGSQPSTKQRCDVLHDDESRSYLANEPSVMSPQAASLSIKTRSTARKTDILAWKSSNDAVGPESVFPKSIGGKSTNIVIDGNLWPVLV